MFDPASEQLLRDCEAQTEDQPSVLQQPVSADEDGTAIGTKVKTQTGDGISATGEQPRAKG